MSGHLLDGLTVLRNGLRMQVWFWMSFSSECSHTLLMMFRFNDMRPVAPFSARRETCHCKRMLRGIA
jgi:hypothetical protein